MEFQELLLGRFPRRMDGHAFMQAVAEDQLIGEERSREEKDEEGGNANAGERRDDGPGRPGEFVDREVGGTGDGSGGGKRRMRML